MPKIYEAMPKPLKARHLDGRVTYAGGVRPQGGKRASSWCRHQHSTTDEAAACATSRAYDLNGGDEFERRLKREERERIAREIISLISSTEMPYWEGWDDAIRRAVEIAREEQA